MEEVLEGIIGAFPYIDDILSNCKSFEEHLSQLEEVFIRLRRENLKAKTRKCKFGFKETKFLGFVSYNEGIKADSGKIPTP